MSLHHYKQYSLVKKDDYSPVYCNAGGEDETVPLACSSIEGLIGMIADWMDVAESTVLDTMDEGELADYKIVREEIETWDLNHDDEAEIKKMKDEADERQAKMRKRFPLG